MFKTETPAVNFKLIFSFFFAVIFSSRSTQLHSNCRENVSLLELVSDFD
jgi:hypothetical protein